LRADFESPKKGTWNLVRKELFLQQYCVFFLDFEFQMKSNVINISIFGKKKNSKFHKDYKLKGVAESQFLLRPCIELMLIFYLSNNKPFFWEVKRDILLIRTKVIGFFFK